MRAVNDWAGIFAVSQKNFHAVNFFAIPSEYANLLRRYCLIFVHLYVKLR